MKKLSVILLLAIGTGLILFHSCQKEKGNKTSSEIQNNFDDDAMTQRIIAFKNNCDYLLNYPDLKTGGSISVDSAVFYISATLNYMYAFDVNISDIRLDTSLLNIAVYQNGTISMQNVASLLEDVTDSVRTHYQNAPYQNKKLIAISLDYYIDHDIYFLKVISATGNTQILGKYGDGDWIWGELLGSCDQTIFRTDAAEVIQDKMDDLYYVGPPSGCRYYWPDPIIEQHIVGPDFQGSYATYLNPNDPDGSNNHLDYIVFYNDDNVNPYTNTLCFEKDDEMAFYESQYINFVDEALDINVLYKYFKCDFQGKELYFSGFDDLNVIRHELKIFVGLRYSDCSNLIYPISIE